MNFRQILLPNKVVNIMKKHSGKGISISNINKHYSVTAWFDSKKSEVLEWDKIG